MDYEETIEKIHIYLSDEVIQALYSDAVLFGVLNKRTGKANLNNYMNLLISGYYEEYSNECQAKALAIKDILRREIKDISNSEIDFATSSIFDEVMNPISKKHKGIRKKRLTITPVKSTEYLFQIIAKRHVTTSLSSFFSQMINEYCQKPLNNREQIIFRDEYTLLLNACKKQTPLTLIINSEKNTTLHVIPYKMSISNDIAFNYLICSNIKSTAKTNEIIQEPMSIRLSRIKKESIYRDTSIRSINEETKTLLDLTIKKGPQFAINDNAAMCVKLTKKGVDTFHRSYWGRPTPDRIEDLDNGCKLYYFSGSAMQLFFYFRRFEGNDAVIISPTSIRKKIIKFHNDAINAYKDSPSSDQ